MGRSGRGDDRRRQRYRGVDLADGNVAPTAAQGDLGHRLGLPEVDDNHVEPLPYISLNIRNLVSGAVSVVGWGMAFPDGGNAIQIKAVATN